MQAQNPPYGTPAISSEKMAPQNPVLGQSGLQPGFQPGQMGPLPIIINQQQPVAMLNPLMFKTTPIATTCIFCHRPCTTVVEKQFNFCTCILCWCTGLLCYVCVQMFRDKDICCCDATHTCPNCGQILGTYTSC